MKKKDKIIEFIANNGQKLLVLLALIFATIQIASILENDTKYKNLINLFSNQYFIIAIIIIATVTILIPFIVKFLYNDRNSKREEVLKNHINQLRESRRIHDLITNKISEVMDKNNNIHELENSLQRRIESNFEESILKKVESKLELTITNSVLNKKINSELTPLVANTIKYIHTIQRNSIINLSIGITGSIFAILTLGFSLLSNHKYNNIEDFSIQIIPRVTFAIFIQLFSFFFLRLYKNNLEDGKYFQNELTNLSAKCSALKIAVLTKNIEKQSEILSNLSQIERNFKIQKEETLLTIEKAKIEKEYDVEILNTFKDFLKSPKKE
ncbi:hypothetical protein SAMN05421786_101425 [Chryseobacterium ureilyticum]|uniref:Uncharacterized protein n=1 Tax=Chryseobacterium ureilyticum TaxID=373668 RepID=A0A1N7KEV8_9FLAO|nr:hypothetical protein [Chryseobacterium ureilyticum]SIS60121.1 hypothetical protein SAMN05421786_101425 [Chryseobacterium ureilyticum]